MTIDVRVSKVTTPPSGHRSAATVGTRLAGRGAKGQRFCDRAVVDLVDPTPGSRQLLIRRSRTTGELACYRCRSAEPVPLTVLVKTAGSRWRAEETFQAEKGLAGLDEHQVRRYRSWTRWVTLAMLAHAFLARGSPCRRTRPQPDPGRPGPAVLQRDPAPVHHGRRAASPRHGLPARPVALAAAPSAVIPHQPLPATGRIPDMSACFRSQGRHSSESGADVLHRRQPARATRPVGRAVSRPGLVRLVGSAGGSRRDVPGGGRAEVMNASPDHP
jgi:hypothetical protein